MLENLWTLELMEIIVAIAFVAVPSQAQIDES